MSYSNNWVNGIRKTLIESHTKEEIEALSTSELKKLHKEYLAKGTVEAKEEAAEIKKEIESRGEEKSETKLDEELLVILDTLCEMVGLDMMNLVELHASGEMTRDDFQNWLHAKGAGAKDKSTEDPRVAAARIKGAKETAKRIGTKSQRAAAAALAGAIKTGKDTAYDIETDAPIEDVHEPTARERAAGAPGAVVDPTKFDRTQGSIEKITNKVSKVEQARQNREEMMKRLLPFALQPKPKAKGKGKK